MSTRFFFFPEISQLLPSIIKRAGVVPMSISGIFKEVTTISVSAWVFGDELTPLNILGVGITFVGAFYYPTTHFRPRPTSSIYQYLPTMMLTASTQALASTRTTNTRKPFTHPCRSIHTGTRYHKRRLRRSYKPRCGSSFLLRKASLSSMKVLVRMAMARSGEGMKKGAERRELG